MHCRTRRASWSTTDGKVLGEHSGVHNFTVGQRKGLGVATGSPLYVLQIKGDTRRWLSEGEKICIRAPCGPKG